MKTDAARMKRWLLWGAPAVLGAAFGGGTAGGWAAWLGWLAAGAFLLPPSPYPYPRKRTIKPRQLFFSFAAGAFLLALGMPPEQEAVSTRLPSLTGTVFFAVLAGTRLLRFSRPPGAVRGGGLALLLLALLLIFYR